MDFCGHSCFARGLFSHRSRRCPHERTFLDSLCSAHGQYYITRVDICPPRAYLFRSRGPFAFTRTRVNLFWSLALRHAWTILHERISFYCLRRICGQYSIKRTDRCLPCADLFRSRIPFFCHGRTSVPRTRTAFIYHDPQVDFSVHSRFACGPFSPRADLFLLLV